MITLEDYTQRIVEPTIQALEKRTGKTRQQLIREYEAALKPHRRVMAQVRKQALREPT
jgi:hypothetical protein